MGWHDDYQLPLHGGTYDPHSDAISSDDDTVKLVLTPDPDTKCKKDFANLVQTILVSKNTPIIKLRSLLMACIDAQSRSTNTDTMQHHPGIQHSADYQLNDLLQHGQIGKIGNLIEKILNINKNCGFPSEADKLQTAQKLHPAPNETTLPPIAPVQTCQPICIDVGVIETIIQHLNTDKASPFSGISAAYLKCLLNSKTLALLITDVANELYNNSTAFPLIPELFLYRLIFIPKSNGNPRPIAIGENILLIMNKALYSGYLAQYKFHNSQLAYSSDAVAKCT